MKQTWNLTETKKHETNGENVYTYSFGGNSFTFHMHPKKAFTFILVDFKGITSKQAWKLTDKWIENAIGPSETYQERIKKFEA